MFVECHLKRTDEYGNAIENKSTQCTKQSIEEDQEQEEQ